MSTEAEAKRIMRAKMKHVGMSFLDSVDLRTAAKLCATGDGNVQDIMTYTIDAVCFAEILKGDDDGFLPGPFVSCRNSEKENSRFVIEIHMALMYADPAVRQTALDMLAKFAELTEPVLTPRTITIIEEHEAALLSEDAPVWINAGCQIYDALNDDFLFSLAGLRQLKAHRAIGQNNLKEYVPRIMRPKLLTFDSIERTVVFGENDIARLGAKIAELIDSSSSLQELCDGYLYDLGCLPLRIEYSLSTLISVWSKGREDVNYWNELWEWCASPLGSYHVLLFFTHNPQYVPEDRWTVYWDEVVKTVSGFLDGTGMGEGDKKWRLWSQLAKLYNLHVEAQVPNSRGVNVSSAAWWLASQTGMVIGGDEATIPEYLDKWLKPELEATSRTWIYGMPPVQERNLFGYLTYLGVPSFGYGLISEAGKHFEQMETEKLSKEQMSTLSNAILFGMSFTAAVCDRAEDDLLILNGSGFKQFVEKFCEIIPEAESNTLKGIVAFTEDIADLDKHLEFLKTLPEQQSDTKGLVAMALRQRCYLEPDIHERVWEIIRYDKWFTKLAQELDSKHLGVCGEALLALVFNDSGDWYFQIPHMFADAFDNNDDKDKRKELFHLLIASCLGTNSVSALQRLLSDGKKRGDCRELAKKQREQLIAWYPGVPGWIQAKIRALLTVLPH